MHFAGKLTPDEFWATVDQTEAEVRRGFGLRPAYTVSGWAGRTMLAEWAFGERGIRSVVCVADDWKGADPTGADAVPRVEVLVDDVEPRQLVAHRQGLERLAAGDGPPWPVEPPEAPDAVIDLPVDGVAEPFELWIGDARAWAAGRIGTAGVLVVAVGYPMVDVSLERLRDIDPLLAERRRWIRAVRGEE
ncbi:hypothetical protein [Agromyces agglutinans]|uniref:hypothetical protein n=1 Tax=Agromyces agglutinans TaxID=2662258 RepID=UPI001562AC93|nr:hypothetical protein [Agromyces agglutinans]